MSTETEQQKMEKIIKEAAMRYPDVARHRVTAKKLFSKVLGIQFYTTEKITTNELFALSGTLMYFAVDKKQQHFIYQHLLGMLHDKDHHARILACVLINKIHSADVAKIDLKRDTNALINPPGIMTPAGGFGLSVAVSHDKFKLTIEFPWAMSREEIKEMIQSDKSMLKLIKSLGRLGVVNTDLLSAGAIGFLWKTLKDRSPWFVVILVLSIIFGVVGYFNQKSEDSLETEAQRRGMSEL